jgi:hypothetical protein
MVRGPLGGALGRIDAGIDKQIRRLRREHEVIDPDPVVAGKGAGLIIPEGIEARARMAQAQRIAIAQMRDAPQRRARGRERERIRSLGRRARRVDVGGNHVVVARQHDRHL